MSYTSWIEAVKSVGSGEKHEPGNVWQTKGGWVGWRHGENKPQYDIKSKNLKIDKAKYDRYKFKFLTYKNSNISKYNYKIIKELMDRRIEKR